MDASPSGHTLKKYLSTMNNEASKIQDLGAQAESHLTKLNANVFDSSSQSPATRGQVTHTPDFIATILGYDIYRENKLKFIMYLSVWGGLFLFWAYPRWCLARQESRKRWKENIESSLNSIDEHFLLSIEEVPSSIQFNPDGTAGRKPKNKILYIVPQPDQSNA
jgi:hypothetical protein